MYASVILPFPLEGAFTYIIPPHLQGKVQAGMRVIVQFGMRRFYTGVVLNVHDNPPEPGIKLKEITEIADEQLKLLPGQLKFWQWMAYYYMCTVGEVMKAALPSGLKLESETLITRNEDFGSADLETGSREMRIFHALKTDKATAIADIAKTLHDPNLLGAVRRLIDLEAVFVREQMNRSSRRNQVPMVRLTGDFAHAETLNQTLDSMKRAKAQAALLMRFLQLSGIEDMADEADSGWTELAVEKGILCPDANSKTTLNLLIKKGILECFFQRAEQTSDNTETAVNPVNRLDKEQMRAYHEINAALAEKEVCLLHGVTSSGKTEVYIQLIRQVISQGGQVLFMLPEIALTTQITNRLSRVFGHQMGVYHSKFPDAQRVELWERQMSDSPLPLILGVRSSLFLPFQNLKLIIVDEEHETSFKQQDPAPRYQARDTAIMLAHSCGAKVLLGSATPSIESYHNARSGKYGLVEMKKRFGHVQMPEIVVADVKELRRKKLMKTPFSPQLTEALRTAFNAGGQAIIFQNRRGYSPVLECRTCGWTPRCNKCDVSLTYHKRDRKLVCHYCGSTFDIPTQCPNCGDTELRDLGYGTEKIEEEAHAIFPEAKTERMDLDTTRSRQAYERIINRFEKNETNLLIGTQMVTKGLDFERVKVVGILNADQMLNQSNFRAYEQAFQMMSQVSGRAGRKGERGLVILQTGQPDESIIKQVVDADYEGMYKTQLEERRTFNFPPFCRLISITLKHRNEEVVSHASYHLTALLRPYFKENLLGPDRPLISFVQLQHIRKILIKIAPNQSPSQVRNLLFSARQSVYSYHVYKSVSIYFDVDPQ